MPDHRFARHIRLAAILAILTGLFVIAGWIYDISVLKTVAAGLPGMKFNTAVCFLLSGVALLLLFSKTHSRRIGGKIIALFVVTISGISFSEDILSYTAGIDELLMKDIAGHSSGIAAPGRMASTTALCFFLLSTAYLNIWTPKKKLRNFLQFQFHAVSLITLLAIIGYMYNVPVLYRYAFLSSMALHTAVFLFILSCASSLIHYTEGVTGLLTGKRIGNQVARRLIPLSVFVTIILGFFSIKAYHREIVNVEYGIALFTVSFTLVSLFMISITARRMNTIDMRRAVIQEDLNKLNKNLEETVIRRTAELKQASDTLNLAASGGNIGIWQVEMKTGVITGNAIFRKILTGSEDEFPAGHSHSNMFDCMHPDDREESHKSFGLLYSTDITHIEKEFRIIWPDKSLHYIQVNGIVEKDDDGNPDRILGAVIDITERKYAEQQLAERYNTIRIFVQEAPLQIAMFDTNMCYMAASNDWIEDHGLSGREIIGQSHYTIFPQITEERKAIHKRCLAGETIRRDAEQVIYKNGNISWFSWVMCPWYISNNEIGGIMICTFDITRQKEQMEALRLSEERYSSMVNNVEDYAIYSIDAKGYIQNWNRGAEVIQGYNHSEAIGEHFSLFFTDAENKKDAPALLLKKVALAGNMQHKGWRMRKDGSVFRALVSITALHNAEGEVIGFSEVVHDLTLREAEAETRKYAAILEAKNKEMEQFVYIASHDLQEPLRTVSNFIQIIEEDHHNELEAPVTDYLNAIRLASLRMNALIQELLNYSRIGRDRRLTEIDCNEILNNVTDDLTALIDETNALIMAPALPVLNGFRRELRQLFQNLITNGIKFRKKDTFPEIEISCEEYNDHFEFTVKDNGIGIEERNFDKIFYIFQRLNQRDEFEGNGIGLANCKKIVELHGGKIWVNSVPGAGSSFHFTIAKQYILHEQESELHTAYR